MVSLFILSVHPSSFCSNACAFLLSFSCPIHLFLSEGSTQPCPPSSVQPVNGHQQDPSRLTALTCLWFSIGERVTTKWVMLGVSSHNSRSSSNRFSPGPCISIPKPDLLSRTPIELQSFLHCICEVPSPQISNVLFAEPALMCTCPDTEVNGGLHFCTGHKTPPGLSGAKNAANQCPESALFQILAACTARLFSDGTVANQPPRWTQGRYAVGWGFGGVWDVGCGMRHMRQRHPRHDGLGSCWVGGRYISCPLSLNLSRCIFEDRVETVDHRITFTSLVCRIQAFFS